VRAKCTLTHMLHAAVTITPSCFMLLAKTKVPLCGASKGHVHVRVRLQSAWAYRTSGVGVAYKKKPTAPMYVPLRELGVFRAISPLEREELQRKSPPPPPRFALQRRRTPHRTHFLACSCSFAFLKNFLKWLFTCFTDLVCTSLATSSQSLPWSFSP
jgi:hypothetical protein